MDGDQVSPFCFPTLISVTDSSYRKLIEETLRVTQSVRGRSATAELLAQLC